MISHYLVFSPSLIGFQELLDVSYDYALSYDIMFYCNKSRGMLFIKSR